VQAKYPLQANAMNDFAQKQTTPRSQRANRQTGASYTLNATHRNTGNASEGCRDSNLAMCLDMTRHLAKEVYDFAQPKVLQGITSVKQLEIKGPQCGPGVVVGRGTRGRSSRRVRRRSFESSSTTSSDDSATIEGNGTVLSSCSDTKTYSSSDSLPEKSRKLRRRPLRRGRSPTSRSNSVNAAKRDQGTPVSLNPDYYVIMERKRVTIAEPEMHSYRHNRDISIENEKPRHQGLSRGSFRQQSSFRADDDAQGREQSAGRIMSRQSPTKPLSGEEEKVNTARRLDAPIVLRLSAATEKTVSEGEACAILDRIPTDCTIVGMSDGSSLSGMSFPPLLPPPPAHSKHTQPTLSQVVQRPREPSPDRKLCPSPSRNQTTSLAVHKHHRNDVKIIVGNGSEQEVFPHNSHVLLYISDYFFKVMVPDSSVQDSIYPPKCQPLQQAWTINFSHVRVSEWKLFYSFLETPIKRTVSLDIYNLPILLPWFHKFEIPHLLHQCDLVLSSLCFRPPPLEQVTTTQSMFSDLQDVLLLLYAGLSCDLPRTLELGIHVVKAYLNESPHLFCGSSNVSVMQRLIILLQCFPHFQQQVWDSVIRSYLPTDLQATCDIETAVGRDALLQNPLFPLLLREGLSKAKVKARTRHYVRSKHQQHRQERQVSSAASTLDELSLESNSILNGLKSASNGTNDSSAPSFSFLGELSSATSLIRSGNLRDASSMEYVSIGRGTRAGEEDQPFLEMPIRLGDQFWGRGWHQEPRYSLEQHQRQKDRRRWLDDIVHRLKYLAQEEALKEDEELSQLQFAPDEVSAHERSPVESEKVVAHEEERSSVVSRSAATAREVRPIESPPRPSDHEKISRKYGKLLILPSSPTFGDNNTATTDTNSLSGLSYHTRDSVRT
jgi:hypothetical protein